MATNYAYTKTDLGVISDSLAALFSDMNREEGVRFIRATNANVVLLASSPKMLGDLDASIEALSLAHPSRFFVVVVDDTAANVDAEVAALCHGLSKSEHSCSEVVRLRAPRRKLSAVPAGLRAHMLSGLTTELFLLDATVPPSLIELLVPMVDQVFLNSADFEDRSENLAQLYRLTSQLVDFQWVVLSTWRDQMRALFDKPSVAEIIEGLEAIEICTEFREGLKLPPQALPSCALLFAGWLVDRLSLKVLSRSQNHFECLGPRGRPVRLDIKIEGKAPQSRLTRVEMHSRGEAGGIISAKLERTEVNESMVLVSEAVVPSQTIRLSRPLDDESILGCIRRYYLIGESFANFESAFRSALTLSGTH